MLRIIQFFNSGGYVINCINYEDGFAPVYGAWDIRLPVELDDYMRCVRENVVLEAHESGAPINAVLTELVEDNGDIFKPRTLVFGLLMLFEMYDEAVFTVPGQSSAFKGKDILDYQPDPEDPLWQDRLIAGVQALQLPCSGSPPPVEKGRFRTETGSSSLDNYPEFYEAVRHLLAIYLRHSCRLTPENLEILRGVFECASYPIEDWLTLFKAADEAGGLQSLFQAIRLDEMIYCNRYLGHLLTAVALGEVMKQSETDRYATLAADGAALFADFVDNRLASHGINEYLSPNYHGVLLDKLSLMYALIRDPEMHARIKALLDYVWYDVAANWWESAEITGLTRECAEGEEPFGMGALLGAHGRAPMFPTGRGSLMDVLRAFGWYTAAEGDSPPYLGYTFASFVSSYRPPDLSAFRVPMDAGESREVWEATGTSGYEQTYNFITGRFALATAQHEYQDPHDMTLTSYLLPTPPEGDIYEPLPGYIIMDAWEDPYGLLKTKKNLGKPAYHVPAFVMSDQDKNQALYLTVSQVYDDDNVLPSAPPVPARFYGYSSNRRFLEKLINRAYGDFYQCDVNGQNCSTNTYGNPEWARTDYLATHFVFPWIIKRTEINSSGTYTYGDVDWDEQRMAVYIGDSETPVPTDNAVPSYMNFMELLPDIHTPVYFRFQEVDSTTTIYVAVRIVGAFAMDGDDVTRVELTREPVLARHEIEDKMQNGTNRFTVNSAETDPTSRGGYVAGNTSTYSGSDSQAPHATMHILLQDNLRDREFFIDARIRRSAEVGNLFVEADDQDTGAWTPSDTTATTLNGAAWNDPPIWKYQGAARNVSDLWTWYTFPEVVSFPDPFGATPLSLYQNAPGVEIDTIRLQFAESAGEGEGEGEIATGRYIYPVWQPDNVHRMRLSVIHQSERGQYRTITNGGAWAAFFVVMGTSATEAAGEPYYYSSLSAFRSAFDAIDFVWSITTDQVGDLLTVEAGNLQVEAYIDPLQRPSPEPAQPSPLLLMRNNGQGSFVPPWQFLSQSDPFDY